MVLTSSSVWSLTINELEGCYVRQDDSSQASGLLILRVYATSPDTAMLYSCLIKQKELVAKPTTQIQHLLFQAGKLVDQKGRVWAKSVDKTKITFLDGSIYKRVKKESSVRSSKP